MFAFAVNAIQASPRYRWTRHEQTAVQFGRKCVGGDRECICNGPVQHDSAINAVQRKKAEPMGSASSCSSIHSVLNELLVSFTVVAANDAHVTVAVAGVSSVIVRRTISTSLRVAAVLVAGKTRNLIGLVQVSKRTGQVA